MDVYEFLKQDHEKVSKLFKQIEKAGAATKREDLFRTLKAELKAHSGAEEHLFYPALKEADQTHDLTLEAIEEHHVVDELLKELDEMPKDIDQWTAKFTVLKENVEHHVKEEEEELFPKARKVLSQERADQLGDETQREKEKLVDQLAA